MVVDAGCRWGATTAWAALQPGLRVYAFDADADECARLGALQQPDDPVRYVPTALAAHRGEAELKIAREPACSSFFPPDPLAMRERRSSASSRPSAPPGCPPTGWTCGPPTPACRTSRR